MALKITVQYCGAWGYSSKYRNLKADLDAEFGDKIQMEGQRDVGATGNFEVIAWTAGNTQVPLHLKNGQSQGLVDNDSKLEAIVDKIHELLK